MYLPVDFLTPLLFVAAAVIFTLFAVPLGLGALVRWKKFRADADGLQTYARRRDLRIQSGVAIVGLALVLAASITAAIGWNESSRNLSANVEARYDVSDVAMTSWNGTWAEVDLVDGKGRPASGMEVFVGPENEPELSGPAFDTASPNDPEPSLDLR